LKKSPTQLLKDAAGEAIAILNHNTTNAYLVPAETYEKMMAIVDDYLLSKEIKNRQSEDFKAIEVSLDEL
jgi:antitoxin StbD